MVALLTGPINWATLRCVFISLVWIRFACIVEVNGGGQVFAGNDYKQQQQQQREFDYFMLSLLWPATACRTAHQCCSSNACCSGSNALTEFTIHGLWPDYNDGTWPACCSGKRFDIKEILKLLSDLNKYWPSLSCDSPSNCHGGKGLFWEHEWDYVITGAHHVACEKHGTCSSPVVRDEYDYFLKALNLYFKYNVTAVLREAGYVASNSEKYPLGGIISAIQNAFHATPELECSGDAVEELRLCFSKDLKLCDCGVESDTERSGFTNSNKACPKYVSLPEPVSLKLENNGMEASQSNSRSFQSFLSMLVD